MSGSCVAVTPGRIGRLVLPLGHDEVALVTLDRPQQLEPEESGRAVDDAGVLRHFKSMLNPGGVAYVSTPNLLTLAPPGAEKSDNPWHLREYRPEEFRALTGTRLSHEFPRYSPDGKRIALLTQDLKKSPRAPYRLSVIDRRGSRLQVLPMSFHGNWQSGQLLSRVMNDLSAIRQFLSFGLLFLMLNIVQIIVVTAILLSMYWPLGVVVMVAIVPITVTILHFQRKFTRAQGQGPRFGDGSGDVHHDLAIGAGLADSCAACHGRPRGSAGVGGDVATRPDSRDAPHLFGLGLKEMLADEITAELREIRAGAVADARRAATW